MVTGKDNSAKPKSPSDACIEIYKDELYERWLAGDAEADYELYMMELMERDD